MKCHQFEKLIMTTRDADRSEADEERLTGHALNCARCAKLREQTGALEELLRASATDTAPDGFTQGVMARVEALREPAPPPWYDRMFGSLKAPAPLVSVSHGLAAAALILMIVSVGALVVQQRVPGSIVPSQGTAVVCTPDGYVIEGDNEFIEDLVERHRMADSMGPLSDDEGMRLVTWSY